MAQALTEAVAHLTQQWLPACCDYEADHFSLLTHWADLLLQAPAIIASLDAIWGQNFDCSWHHCPQVLLLSCVPF